MCEFSSSTDQWAQIAVAGPKSRLILQTLVDEDISDAAFPFLGAKEVSLCGGKLTGRLFRISFPPANWPTSWRFRQAHRRSDRRHHRGSRKAPWHLPLWRRGARRHAHREGHVTHSEIYGTVIPSDLGFAKMVSTTKPDFIGKAMLSREGLTADDRLSLVGVKPLDPATTFKTGSHILSDGAVPRSKTIRATFPPAAIRPTSARPSAWPLVKHGPKRHGEHVTVWNDLKNEYTKAVLCSPVFFDRKTESSMADFALLHRPALANAKSGAFGASSTNGRITLAALPEGMSCMFSPRAAAVICKV